MTSSFFRARTSRRARWAVVLLCFACGSTGLGGGCKKSSSGAGAASTDVVFHGTTPLFTGFMSDSGLVPPGSPVQVELMLSATGATDVDAAGKSGGSGASATVYGTPGSGKVTVHGGFALQGKLSADVKGFTKYDGPIPGFDNVNIQFTCTAMFDPFLIGGKAHAEAPIPATMLPAIPLPGGIPGDLVISIDDGSVVTADFSGTCAAFDGKHAHYVGSTVTGGTLKLKPTVEITIPLVGKKTFDIPEITVAIPPTTSAMDLGSPAAAAGDGTKPAGDAAKVGTCAAPAPSGTTGSGGSGGSATTSTSTTSNSNSTSTTSATTDATSTGSTTSTGSGSVCDMGTAPDMTACNECITCAENWSCTTQQTACGNDMDCVTLSQCENACAANDMPCVTACLNAAPAAAQNELNDFSACVYCTACPISCDAKSQGCP